MKLIFLTLIISTCIIMIVQNTFKLSKCNIENILNNRKEIFILIISIIIGFIALYFELDYMEKFFIPKYWGICTYGLFLIVAFFGMFNLLIFKKGKSELKSYRSNCSCFITKIIIISSLSCLWIVSNVCLEKRLYIIVSVPIVMCMLMIIVLIQFLVDKRK